MGSQNSLYSSKWLLRSNQMTFKVTALIDPISTEKSEFITEILKLAEFPDRNRLSVEVVKWQ